MHESSSQYFLTNALNSSVCYQKLKVLKGLGPQSITVFLTTNAQWSNTCLLKMYCLDPDHYINHVSDTKTLSNVILDIPFERYQIYHLPTIGISYNLNSINLSIRTLLSVYHYRSPFFH